MSCIPAAFDSFRCAYDGATDSVDDVDVDPHGGRIYAACSNGDVCIWDIRTQSLVAKMRHPCRVNAVRCFPLFNSAASFAMSPPPAWAASPAGAAASGEDSSAPYSELVGNHDIRWVLSASEDGVVSVWCPMTYRMQSATRLGSASITALTLIPETPSSSTSEGATLGIKNSAGLPRCQSTLGVVDYSVSLCCAVSLRDVFLLRATMASSQLAPLRVLKQGCRITALAYVAPSASLSSPLLVLGQEEGTLSTWDCSTWLYRDTMLYPGGEADVVADARDDPTSVHEPVYQLGRVSGTFLYNRRRCNASSDEDACEEEADVAATVNPSSYIREMPAWISADALGILESHCGALSPDAKKAFVEQQQGRDGMGSLTTPSKLTYDARRVTCLAASPNSMDRSSNSYLYSGHATGEVLLWGSVRQLPFLLLLKKILLFRPGVWVWNLCSVATLHTNVSQLHEKGRKAKAPPRWLSQLEKKKGQKAAKLKAGMPHPSNPMTLAGLPSQPQTTHVSPLELIVWSDGGVVEYVSTRKRHVLHRPGPGFVSAAACVWSGAAIAEPVVPQSPSDVNDDATASPTSKSGHPRLFSAHQYLVMGGFDGRVERYDITEALGLVESSGKLL
ncbi:hypothetical protein JKF63_01331 [Porcisia hertigi]|uniref:Uncharacterized protein n=1 Tax=Porcisia hertigi TaxID=2761500 RepID=A0A836HGB0_9TRYP|nr:hypothetical protein JKF63_01331 [Porcisia hertigi]